MQLFAILIITLWSGSLAFIFFTVIDRFIGLRVSNAEEEEGLDAKIGVKQNCAVMQYQVHDDDDDDANDGGEDRANVVPNRKRCSRRMVSRLFFPSRRTRCSFSSVISSPMSSRLNNLISCWTSTSSAPSTIASLASMEESRRRGPEARTRRCGRLHLRTMKLLPKTFTLLLMVGPIPCHMIPLPDLPIQVRQRLRSWERTEI